MKIFTSWDDGRIKDLKLFNLLKKYPIKDAKHIFFISNNGCELSPSDIKTISESFEVGGHTVTHPTDLKLLSSLDLLDEIEGNKFWLENIIHRPIEWFCYPKGHYNDRVIEVVKRAGFKFARTVVLGYTDFNTDVFRIHTTVQAYPGKEAYQGKHWVEYAKEKFLEAKLKDGYFHLWGHSWELDKFQQWDGVENLLQFIYEHNNK
jgi:peptidoglycan-N-acetylglucosamine deacetylase